MKRRWTWLWRGVLAGTIVIALAAIVLVLLAATSGVLATRADDWRIRVPLLKYRTQELALPINVAGATRLALSPLGRRLLDGRAFTTRFGHVQLARRERALVIRCAPCRVNDARVASQTVSLQAIELRLTPRTDALDLAPLDGVLIGGGARVNFVADLRRSGVTLEWDLPSTEIAQLVRLLADAVPEARRAQIGGTVQARGRVKLPAKQARTELRIADFSVEGLGTESLRYGSFDHLCAGASAFRTSGEGTTDWIGLDALGRWLPAGVIAAEDQRFATHIGLDLEEIERVLANTGGERPRGASTLTQQLARTIYTGGERTFARKLRETLYAVEMERTLGKPRILELYLNTVNWGPGLCGARNAARVYFNRAPHRLTAVQAAWLAGILRHPQQAYARQYEAQAPDLERATWVLMQLRELPKRERERLARQPLALEVPPASRRAAGTTRVAGAP